MLKKGKKGKEKGGITSSLMKSHTKTPAYVVLNDLRLIHDMTF